MTMAKTRIIYEIFIRQIDLILFYSSPFMRGHHKRCAQFECHLQPWHGTFYLFAAMMLPPIFLVFFFHFNWADNALVLIVSHDAGIIYAISSRLTVSSPHPMHVFQMQWDGSCHRFGTQIYRRNNYRIYSTNTVQVSYRVFIWINKMITRELCVSQRNEWLASQKPTNSLLQWNG